MIGEVVLLAALLFNLIPQIQMGASWRFGVDEASRPGLVQGGIFRFSRNPMYVALMMANWGTQLLYPTALSVILVIGQFGGLRRAVQGEEEYLRKAYGDDYIKYAQRVGRFLPGMGLLAATPQAAAAKEG
jgi:protein-S-isoprenylcysteine O-methyltransferase Ste14